MIATKTKNIIDVDWEFHSRQSRALDILESIECEELCFGGAKGGGKTVLGCRWGFMIAMAIIDKYDLEPSKYPLLIGFMGRKRGVDYTKTTLETWKKEIPAGAYRINEQKKEIVIFETVKYQYGGFDDREVVEKFNSAEYCVWFVDQAEEVSQDEIAMLRAAMRLKINGQVPDYKGLLSCNPAQCWIKREFVKNPKGKEEGLFFLQSLPADNPYLPEIYVSKLRKAFRHQPEMLEAYLHGSWDAIEGEDIIIRDKWVLHSHQKGHNFPPKKKFIVADIARFGDDRTTIYYMEDTNIKKDDVRIYGKRDTNYTSNVLARLARKKSPDRTVENSPPIVIDGDGLGGPVADNLRAWGYNVYVIHSAAASSKPEEYYNLRAQMWWEAGQMFADGEVYNEYEDDELDTELTIPKYTLRAGRILVESKEDIKKPERYGKSTDLADPYVYGLYFYKNVEMPKRKTIKPTQQEGTRYKRRRKRRSAWAA